MLDHLLPEYFSEFDVRMSFEEKRSTLVLSIANGCWHASVDSAMHAERRFLWSSGTTSTGLQPRPWTCYGGLCSFLNLALGAKGLIIRGSSCLQQCKYVQCGLVLKAGASYCTMPSRSRWFADFLHDSEPRHGSEPGFHKGKGRECVRLQRGSSKI